MNTTEVVLPSYSSPKQLAQDFSDFFVRKVETIRPDIRLQAQSASDLKDIESGYTGVKYVEFAQTSVNEVKTIIKKNQQRIM